MSAARMRARADIRARPLSLVLVSILVGLIGGLAITALAGARRSDSAYPRDREATNSPEAVVLSCPNGFPASETDLAAVGALPQVAASTIAMNTPANIRSATGAPLYYRREHLNATVIGLRDPAGASVAEPRVLAGRLPVGPDEAAVAYGNTSAPRPQIGDAIDVFMPAAADVKAGEFPSHPDDELSFRMHVVGRVLLPGELLQDQGNLWVSPAFVHAVSDTAWTCDAAIVQLHRGFDDSTAFLSLVYGLNPQALVLDLSAEATFVSRTVHLDAIILRLLAVLAGIAGALVLGQSLVRRTSLASIDTPILRALGMTRRQIVGAAAIPGIAVAAGGTLIAVTVAVFASAIFPTGVAHVAEPDPGIRVDPLAIAAGVAVILLTTLLSVIVPARFAAGARAGVEGSVEYRGAERRSRIAGALGRLPLPPSAAAGARLALEPGHGRSATPVRSAVVGLSLAVAFMIAAFGFAASMDHFGRTPRLWGVDFGFGTGQPFAGDAFQRRAVPMIVNDPGTKDVAVGNFQQYVAIDGPGGSAQEAVWALDTVKGDLVSTTMLEGTWPSEQDQLGLGRGTLEATGLRPGDTARVSAAGTTVEMTVVGVPVFPDFGFGVGLGRGAAMTMGALRRFFPDITENLALGNLAPGADQDAILRRWNTAVLRDMDAAAEADSLRTEGATVEGTIRSRTLPLQLSALFAVAALATLVHVLLTSVRRRRRDLAILQTLGFRRGQVAATIAWQAVTLAGLALLIGMPLGILLGRLGWSAFAYRLGVVSEPVISPLSAIVIPVILVASLLVSLGPGIAARRVRPATVLKAE